ncbi:MAG: hypothetical protein J1F42_10300 [Lachnospiraceae bacterium]|nr:hypothetical protein [Lachnospiraceae bacterium]
MKTKILYIGFTLSVVLTLVMVVYLVTWEPECDHVHRGEIEIDRTKDIVPDEVAAEKIARYSLREGGYAGGFSLSHEDEFVYDASVTFNEQTYEWIIDFDCFSPEGDFVIFEGISLVGVRRDNGYFTWYADPRDIPGYYEIWEGHIEEWKQSLQ